MSGYGRSVAIVLAAGSGKRMGSGVKKQFLPLCGKPVLYWTLQAFEESAVDSIVLVVGGEADAENIRPFGFSKVERVVTGGVERYDSVYAGLCAVPDADYVLIHDGARCLVTPEIIEGTLSDAVRYGSGVAAVPVKDTVRVFGADGFAGETPDRRTLYAMQTPQTFSFPRIKNAYEKLMKETPVSPVTDDAMVLASECGERAHLSAGSYENLKITTPEDLVVADAILRKRLGGESEPPRKELL